MEHSTRTVSRGFLPERGRQPSRAWGDVTGHVTFLQPSRDKEKVTKSGPFSLGKPPDSRLLRFEPYKVLWHPL